MKAIEERHFIGWARDILGWKLTTARSTSRKSASPWPAGPAGRFSNSHVHVHDMYSSSTMSSMHHPLRREHHETRRSELHSNAAV